MHNRNSSIQLKMLPILAFRPVHSGGGFLFGMESVTTTASNCYQLAFKLKQFSSKIFDKKNTLFIILSIAVKVLRAWVFIKF